MSARGKEMEAFERQYELKHPEVFYRGFMIMGQINATTNEHSYCVYDRSVGILCNEATIEASKIWIDARYESAARIVSKYL